MSACFILKLCPHNNQPTQGCTRTSQAVPDSCTCLCRACCRWWEARDCWRMIGTDGPGMWWPGGNDYSANTVAATTQRMAVLQPQVHEAQQATLFFNLFAGACQLQCGSDNQGAMHPKPAHPSKPAPDAAACGLQKLGHATPLRMLCWALTQLDCLCCCPVLSLLQ